MHWSKFHLIACALVIAWRLGVAETRLKLNTGKETGMPAEPDTYPDFTRCDQTTPEDNYSWRASIRDGGRHGATRRR